MRMVDCLCWSRHIPRIAFGARSCGCNLLEASRMNLQYADQSQKLETCGEGGMMDWTGTLMPAPIKVMSQSSHLASACQVRMHFFCIMHSILPTMRGMHRPARQQCHLPLPDQALPVNSFRLPIVWPHLKRGQYLCSDLAC